MIAHYNTSSDILRYISVLLLLKVDSKFELIMPNNADMSCDKTEHMTSESVAKRLTLSHHTSRHINLNIRSFVLKYQNSYY